MQKLWTCRFRRHTFRSPMNLLNGCTRKFYLFLELACNTPIFRKKYWKWAIRNVATCKTTVLHSVTGEVSFKFFFGRFSSYTKHICPFGSQVLFQKGFAKLPKLKERIRSGICLWNEGDGLYRALKKGRNVRTKLFVFRNAIFLSLQFLKIPSLVL